MAGESSTASRATTDPLPSQSVAPISQAKEKRKSGWVEYVPVAVLLLAMAISLPLGGDWWKSWVSRRQIQETDDAYVRADLTPLSTRVSGTVARVAVDDYQIVKAGELLVQLKDEDYKAQVEQAEATVQAAEAGIQNIQRQKLLQDARIAQAEAGIAAAKAQIAQAEAGIEASMAQIQDAEAAVEATKADVVRTELERERQESLIEAGAATRQRLEQVVAEADRFRANLAGREATLAQARAGLNARRADLAQAGAALVGRLSDLEAQRRQRDVVDSQETQARADLSARKAGLKVAQTNLEYTRIVAPEDGIVSERKVRLGQLVSPGTQVLSLVQRQPWVLANYQETQLANVRKGNTVDMTIDGLPGVTLKGHVAEVSPASGSQFALLPPDNATGNFTKIVQRIPVKIVFESDGNSLEQLRPGMSVIARIRTNTTSARNAPKGEGN
jgi:membrane fusion protein (multidrug efflux system)